MEKLLAAEHVADFPGMHPKTLYKKLRENTIALNFIKLPGRNIGFRPRDVERYLELHEVTRDGSGQTKHNNGARKRKLAFRFMTGPEAQAFFDGIEKIDGALECDPDGDPS